MADESLNPALVKSVKEFHTWWKKHRRDRDESEKIQTTQYHYTSAAGLAGIIETESIWFTSVFHLNDPSELSYGIAMATDVLTSEADGKHEMIRHFCDQFEKVLRDEVPKIFGYYIASFSNDDDELGQWRAYADDGKGFAIGLAPHLFHPKQQDITKTHPLETIFVAPIVYDPNEVRNNLRDAIKRAIDIIERAIQSGNIKNVKQCGDFLREMSIALAPPILWTCNTTKHRSYKTEAETRLLLVNDKTKLEDFIKTRVRGSTLVPYVSSPMKVRDAGSIMEIVLGPAAPNESEAALRTFLESRGLKVPIRRSKIPYRSYRP